MEMFHSHILPNNMPFILIYMICAIIPTTVPDTIPNKIRYGR